MDFYYIVHVKRNAWVLFMTFFIGKRSCIIKDFCKLVTRQTNDPVAGPNTVK